MVACGKCGKRCKCDIAQRELDKVFLEISQELSLDELGGRRRTVWYRNRNIRSNEDFDLGVPGYPNQKWQRICPTPSTSDVRRDFNEDQIGLIEQGDIEMRVDRLAVPRTILARAEFYIHDHPDAPEPSQDQKANYDLIGGYVLEGGSGVRERYRSFWVCFLRRRQVNDTDLYLSVGNEVVLSFSIGNMVSQTKAFSWDLEV